MHSHVQYRESMFEANKLGEIKFTNCLQLVLQAMMSKVIANDNSCVGIVFFGTVSLSVLYVLKFDFLMNNIYCNRKKKIKIVQTKVYTPFSLPKYHRHQKYERFKDL
jgi:hypothetical protein